MLHFAVERDTGFCEKAHGLRAIESRMHAGDEVQSLRNPYPAWKHSDVGNEADIAHEQIALFPGIATENPQLSLIRNKPEHCVERRSLARTVGADNPENAALFDTEISAVERDGRPERLMQAACFNACHSNQRSSFFPDFDS